MCIAGNVNPCTGLQAHSVHHIIKGKMKFKKWGQTWINDEKSMVLNFLLNSISVLPVGYWHIHLIISLALATQNVKN